MKHHQSMKCGMVQVIFTLFYIVHLSSQCISYFTGYWEHSEANYNYNMILASGIFNNEVDNEKHAEVLKAKNRKQKNHGDGEKKSFTKDYVKWKDKLNCHFIFYGDSKHLCDIARYFTCTIFLSCEVLLRYCLLQVPTIANVAKKIKLKFTKVWMCFLSLPLPLDVYKEVYSYNSTSNWCFFARVWLSVCGGSFHMGVDIDFMYSLLANIF